MMIYEYEPLHPKISPKDISDLFMAWVSYGEAYIGRDLPWYYDFDPRPSMHEHF